MTSRSATPTSAPTQGRDVVVRLGGWLFKRRSWLPLPFVLLLLLLPRGARRPELLWSGIALVGLGEAVRIWAVHHIGVISRTRSERLGPLISTGPFALVRNPLYLGNVALWLGFTVATGRLWLTPIVLLLLAIEYHAIVRWEEELLLSRVGSRYREYMAAVPRWTPRWRRPTALPAEPDGPEPSGGHSWVDTLNSERSTLLAIALGTLLVVGRWSNP